MHSEIVPGIHRLESYIGAKLLAHHLLTGERALLIDTGTPELAQQELVPWLGAVLGDPARLDMVLVTHADVDHFGGLAVIRAACPHAIIWRLSATGAGSSRRRRSSPSGTTPTTASTA